MHNTEDYLPGSLIEMELFHFMCHDHLRFKFSPNINFLIGENGSGKSAVLNALTLGFGGRAGLTTRSNSISNFIQENHNSATIKITICNYSSENKPLFRPEKYGSKIVIIRKIANSSGSQYKLMSEKNILISTKCEELNAIRRHFCIELDNPICILNQEYAKTFMASINPSNFYKFFAKAARFDRMVEMYKASEMYVNSVRSINNERKEIIDDLQSQLNRLKLLIDQKNNANQWTDKITELKQERACLNYSKLEKVLDDVVLKIEKNTNAIKNIEEEANEVTLNQERFNNDLLKIEKSEITTDEIEQSSMEYEQLKQSILTAKDFDNSLKLQINLLKTELNQLEKELDELGNELKKRDPNRHNLQPEIEELKFRRDENLKNLETIRTQRNTLSIKKHEWTLVQNDLKAKITSEKTDYRNLEEKLSLIQQAQIDKKRRYGPWIPQVLKAIEERASRFEEKPLGPIEWAVAIERCVRSVLGSFICFNYNDENVLKQILAEVIPSSANSPSVIVANIKSINDYNINRFRPNIDLPVVLDMLTFKDDRVGCVLIDQCRIDSNILCDSRMEATKLIQEGKCEKANIRRIFTKDGCEIIPGSNQTFRLYACPKNVGSLLRQEMTASITHIQSQITNKQKSLSQLEKQLSEHYNSSQFANSNQFEFFDQTEKQLNRLNKDLQLKIDSLTDQLKQLYDPSSLEFIQNEIESVKVEMEKKTNELSQKDSERESHVTKLEELLSKRDILKKKRIEQIQDIEKQKNIKNKILSDLEKCESKQRNLESQKKILVSEQKNLEDSLENIKKDISVEADKLRLQFDRIIITKRSVFEIESDIAKATGNLKACKVGFIGTQMDTIEDDASKLEDRIKTSTLRLENDIEHLKEYEASLLTRRESLHIFQNSLSARCSTKFEALLECRDFEGFLEFDHDKQLLHVNVTSIKSNRKRAFSDLKSLSGGERSFSSICFLLSMWDAVLHPFRCLDEFDVFMDQTNIEVVTTMLVAAAENNNSQNTRQFLFISPQGTCLQSSTKVNILKMKKR